jgi:predicted esterase
MSAFALVMILAGASSPIDPFDPGTAAMFEVDLDSIKTAASQAYNAGEYEAAASLYLEALQYDIRSSGDIYNLACCFGLLGRDTLAATYLELSVQSGFSDIGWAAFDPDFDAVRSSPFFTETFERLASVLAAREAGAGFPAFATAEVMIPCRIHVPSEVSSGRPVDLVIGLHGYGGSADGFSALWARFSSPDFVFVAPEAPYVIAGGNPPGFSWSTGSPIDSLAEPASWQLSSNLVKSVIEQMRGRFNIDEIYILGFSQGCSLAYTAGLSANGLVDGIICFAGFLDESTLQAGALGGSDRPRIFIAHGAADRIVDPSNSAEAEEVLTGLGYDVTYVTFDGGHQVPDSLLMEAQEWMRR